VVVQSNSTLGTGRLQEAVEHFAPRPGNDEIFLVRANATPPLVVPFTANIQEVQDRPSSSSGEESTTLVEAIRTALREIGKARNLRKALLVISDDPVADALYTPSELESLVQGAPVSIHTVRVVTEHTPSALSLLRELAGHTGGRHYSLTSGDDLTVVSQRMAIEIRNQYVLAYRPTRDERSGVYHRIQVSVRPILGLPALKAFSRPGYYVSADPGDN
jgi:Ca-activated chloride channel family protein